MSWRGFVARCRACGWTPGGEATSTCDCGQEFDVFSSHGRCPSCRRVPRRLACPGCGAKRSWTTWVRPRGTRSDLVLFAIGAVLLACAWNARALVCMTSERAQVTAVAAGWRETDPWGRPLAAKINSTSLGLADVRVFSAGPNGVDEAGTGDDIVPWERLSWESRALTLAPSIALSALVAALLTVLIGRTAPPARYPFVEGLVVVASSAPLALFVYVTIVTGDAWVLEAATAMGVRTGAYGVMATGLVGVVVLAAALRRMHVGRV